MPQQIPNWTLRCKVVGLKRRLTMLSGSTRRAKSIRKNLINSDNQCRTTWHCLYKMLLEDSWKSIWYLHSKKFTVTAIFIGQVWFTPVNKRLEGIRQILLQIDRWVPGVQCHLLVSVGKHKMKGNATPVTYWPTLCRIGLMVPDKISKKLYRE